MIATLENVIALEVTTNKNGYRSLHVYELGKGSYGFRTLNLSDSTLDSAVALVGKRANVNISIYEGNGKNGKYTSYAFESATPAK